MTTHLPSAPLLIRHSQIHRCNAYNYFFRTRCKCMPLAHLGIQVTAGRIKLAPTTCHVYDDVLTSSSTNASAARLSIWIPSWRKWKYSRCNQQGASTRLWIYSIFIIGLSSPSSTRKELNKDMDYRRSCPCSLSPFALGISFDFRFLFIPFLLILSFLASSSRTRTDPSTQISFYIFDLIVHLHACWTITPRNGRQWARQLLMSILLLYKVFVPDRTTFFESQVYKRIL